jgi:N-acetylglucosamine kinase-like BadF-type ATPase
VAQNLAQEIIEAVADDKGVDPTELEFRLADYIDVDAVNQLADCQQSTWTLTFELPDQKVTVTSDETVLVDGNRDPTGLVA